MSVPTFAHQRGASQLSIEQSQPGVGVQSTTNMKSQRAQSRGMIRRDMMQIMRQNRHTVSQKEMAEGDTARGPGPDRMTMQSGDLYHRNLGLDSLASAYITAPETQPTSRKLIRDTMSISVNFGTFKSKMVGIRPRNQNKQQNSSKLNMAAIEQEFKEQDDRLKMLG